MNPFRLLSLSLFFCFACTVSGQTATITGVVLGQENQPLSDVNVLAGGRGTTTDLNGFYLLEVPSEVIITLVF
ncbi:hypothetical protein, partial [Muriicola sp.]|uniref:hypothetical protein n=1 Tax=Muriicola sp. TaxID=2020856 RepID=UPI003561C6B6